MSKQRGHQIIEKIEGTNISIMNWHGFRVPVGGQYTPFFFNEIEGRRTLNKSNIILVTGAPGEGKTYNALRLAEIFDSKFNVEIQVAFTREQLLNLIGNNSPLKRGQVIIIDEAQYSMGSRNWYVDVQKDIMEAIESVRSRGYIIIIVALHLNLLDVIIRKYVLSYMIHLEERGLGIVYRLYTPRFESEMHRYRLGKLRLLLPDAEKCNHSDCLECKYRKNCLTSRAIYERLKKDFVGKRSKLAEERAIEMSKRLKKISNKEIIDYLHNNRDKFVMNNRNRVDIGCIQLMLEEGLALIVGLERCKSLRSRYEIKHPKKEE